MKKLFLSILMVVTALTATFAQEARYGIERAIVRRNTVTGTGLMQQSVSSVQYIDDFGRKESVEAFLNVQGQMFTVFTMIKDGYVYSINLAAGQGARVNLADMGGLQTVNYLNLTNEIREMHQIKEMSNEQFMEKDCKRYDLIVNNQGQTANVSVWVWQGLPLKSVTNVAGNTVVEEVTEIREGAEIAKEKFELPEGINLVDVTP